MEFQAIVMAAGKGSRMTDITAKCPKALLPIGNMPMVWYPINMLERAGFEEVIVVTLESWRAELQKTLVEVCHVNIRLDVVGIPDTDFIGTADTIRLIKDKIKTDFLVLSCDLITDASLQQIADIYRTYDASLTILLSSLPEQFADVPAPGVKTKKKTERDFVGFDEKGNRLLFMASEAELDETVSFRKSLLKKHPCMTIKTRLTDCHLYLMKKWIVDFLVEHKSISTLKGELLPYMVKKQFSKPKVLPQANASVLSTDTKTDIHSFISEDSLAATALAMSSWRDHNGDMADAYHGDKMRCYAFIQEGGFCVRTNTLRTYAEANRQITRHMASLAPNRETTTLHPSVTIKEKSGVGSDCLVGEGTTIGEKVSVKRSVIGKHCTIADKVKITNCILMDHVTVCEGSNLQGSILCNSAYVNEKCEMKDCVVGVSQSIIANGKFANEAIVDIEML